MPRSPRRGAAVDAGADSVDVGGAKFAPGPAIPVDEEIDRVRAGGASPRTTLDAVVSVDTFQPEVARAAIAAGAHVINDTTGLHDPAWPASSPTATPRS